MKHNNKRIPVVFPINFSEIKASEAPEEINILPLGEWKHPAYGPIKITSKDLNEFIKNFSSGLRKDLPITEGHETMDEKPAIAWFKELVNKGSQGLWAVIEWTERGQQLLTQKAYKYFSPEFYSQYEDPETQKVYKNVLVGGALTNKPYFKELEAVVMSELKFNQFNEKNNMDLKELLKKEVSELTDEEKGFINEHKDELSDEEKDTYKDVIGETDDGDKGDGGEDDNKNNQENKKTDNDEEKGEDENDEKKKEASENNVVISASEKKILEEKADQGAQAMSELNKMKANNLISKLVFSETNKEGKILPKSKDKVVNFYLSLDNDQQKAFSEIMEELPKQKIFNEIGNNSKVVTGAVQEKIDSLIGEKMKADDGLKYADALVQVFKENPDIKNEYEEESAK